MNAYDPEDGVTDIVVVEAQSLAVFAERANAEHQRAADAASSAIDHAIAAGEALLGARDLVRERGDDWRKWVANNLNFGYEQAARYCRIAFFQEEVRASGAIGVRGAIRVLRELKSPNRQHTEQYQPQQKIGETSRRKIEALSRKGIPRSEIAEQFGVSRSTVYKWINPSQRREYERTRRRRLAAQREALRRQERDRLAKRVEGDISKAYSLTRRTAEILDSASRREQESDARMALTAAIRLLYRVEDEIVRALKTSRPAKEPPDAPRT